LVADRSNMLTEWLGFSKRAYGLSLICATVATLGYVSIQTIYSKAQTKTTFTTP
jgi:uncharacterized protein YsxB (DUF464 family)